MNDCKKVLLTTLVFILVMGTRGYAQDLTIKLDPPIVNVLTIGDVCSLDVVIENVSNLGAFQFDIVFRTDSVHADTALVGDFLGSTNRTVLPVGPTIDNNSQPGRITFGAATLGVPQGPNGSGTLATVVFTSLANGNAKLEFENVQVSDIGGQAMTIIVIQPGEVITKVDKPRGQTKNPELFQVFQNYPNPFNPHTTIIYTIPQQLNNSTVNLVIYTMLGQQMRTLANEKQMAGTYSIHWDGKSDSGKQVSSGIYVYRLTVGKQVKAKKMILLK